MKVTTFSRTFPSHHPRKGQPTFFVEKILNQIGIDYREDDYLYRLYFLNERKIKEGKLTNEDLKKFFLSLNKSIQDYKLHTIRSGNRFSSGDVFAPCIWSDKVNPKSGRKGAYHSPQIQFAPNTEVKKIWEIEIYDLGFCGGILIGNKEFYVQYSDSELGEELLSYLAKNDGLEAQDLLDWFNFPSNFQGQIICFSNNVNY